MLAEILTGREFRVLMICLSVLALERARPWRKEQQWRRPQFYQDIFWFALNAFGLSFIFGDVFRVIARGLKTILALFSDVASHPGLLASFSLPLQIVLALVILDFVEWCIHNLLHRIPFLWRIHRLHHSIHHMDWMGNFRFHPFEILVYFTIRYIPALLLGASKDAAIWAGSISLLIGNLNHSNLKLSFGPLRYILNSPMMHIWHHDAHPSKPAGVNFGITLSIWDWIFTTAYMPKNAIPQRLGFAADKRYPEAVWKRLLSPVVDLKK
ncbi:MAG: sterol desaturase family protein [Deltaproteobacteria bacterium]|nr:sterol desaturase family protein [Deltaproteobacteria bacterium]